MFPKRAAIRKKIQWQILKYSLKGNFVECLICEQKYITFLPFGLNHKRPNALCINCLSLERHRLIWRFLHERTDLFEPSRKTRLLHVAPEPSFFARLSVNPAIDYYPADRFEGAYKYPKGTIDMDITRIGFPDDYFDAIICNHVFEHIPDDRLAMTELCRVLNKDGWALLQVPIEKELEKTLDDSAVTDPAERARLFGQEDHVRQYGLDYADRLAESGFLVTVDKMNERFSKDERFRYGLPKDTDLYYCRKGGTQP